MRRDQFGEIPETLADFRKFAVKHGSNKKALELIDGLAATYGEDFFVESDIHFRKSLNNCYLSPWLYHYSLLYYVHD